MKKSFMKKAMAGFLAFCMIASIVNPEWVQVAKANTTAPTQTYTSMEAIETDFKGVYQDEDVSLGADSNIITDSNIEDLRDYETDYTTGGYTSLADYLFSVNSDGEVVRDNAYGVHGNRRNGFLYYDTKMTNFTVELEYKHGLAGQGWRSTYIGFGAQEIGDNFYTNQHSSSIRVQPTEMYLENQAGTNNYTFWSEYAGVIEKYNTAADAGNEVWYSFKLTIEDGVATWTIDGQQFSQTLTNYMGGYFYIGTMACDTAFRNIRITCNDIGFKYNTMAGVEDDFKGVYQDEDVSLGADSNIITDGNIEDLRDYETDYTTGGYTSLADYLFSVNSDGEVVRDNAYGVHGNRRNGFLYYDTKMTNFTVELEYKHGLAGQGWRSTYIGFGAQEIGNNFHTDQHASSIRVQPTEMYLENQAGTNNYTFWSEYAGVIEKYNTAEDEGNEVWYSFKLTVEDGVATWTIDGQQFSQTLMNYIGGYFYIGTMACDTAFRNIKITCNDKPDYSMYDVYYATEYSDTAQRIYQISKIEKTDFENCWSLKEGTFTRTGTGEYAGATNASSGASMLYFNDKSYDAFEMEFDYSFGTAVNDWKWLAVGFGADAPGKSFVEGDGYLAFVEQEGSVKYIHPENNDAKYAISDISTDVVEEYSSTVKGVANDKWHHAKIRVAAGLLTISYDDGTEYSAALSDYAGYVYLCSFTQTMQFKNVSITEVSDAADGFVEQFSAYYLPNGTDCRKGTALTAANVSDLWTVSGETLTRAGEGVFAAGPNAVNGASMLYFEETYTNFELSYDFSFNGTTATWKWVGAGFGASEKGKYFGENDGFMAFIEQEGYRSLFEGSASRRVVNKEIVDYKTALSTGDTSWHTYKLVVKGKNVEIYIDDYEVGKTTIQNYSGGYVYLFCATPGMTIKNISLKESTYVIPELQKQFTAFYLPNGQRADKEFVTLTSAEVDELWIVTEDSLTRSGSGDFEAGPNETQGASMLYFKDKYTNFMLSYDFTFNGTTTTWKWVAAGFGASDVGKYYGDDDGYLAFIEQEGYRSMFDGQTSFRFAGELADYKALLNAGDSTWHTYKLVVKGSTVEIYLDNYEVATTTLDNYTGGYVYLFGATPNMQLKNIEIQEITYIESTDVVNNITVNVGTDVSALNLPTSMKVTLNDQTSTALPIVWDTSNYDANVADKYVLEGTLDITGTNVYQNDSARKVKVVVTVADFNTNAVRVYDFTSNTQIDNTFVSYYVGKDKKISATSELKGADASLTWQPTDNGGIKRIGTGDYAASATENLAGSLLYFRDKYTEFELDFDYTFNGTTGGWRWMSVGVGAEAYGKNGYTTDGGTLAVVEMEGQIRTFVNNSTALITDKEAFGEYKETVSNTTHHMRVAVKNSRMYIFVDDYPMVDTALPDYNGGYIYLYGFTENLEIYNLRISKIATAELVDEIPYKSVQVGTAISEIGLPTTLKVKLNGQLINCPVEWSSPDYNNGVEGTYNFFATPIGVYSHFWLSQDTKRIQVGVTVGNTDEDVVQNFAMTSTEELVSYFENYYCKSEYQLFEDGVWQPTYVGNTWKLNSKGILKRTGKTSDGYGGGDKGTYGVAALYYKEKMENFEIEFDYQHGVSGWKWVSVAFGMNEIGDTYYDNGYLAWVEQEGKVRVQGSTNGERMNFTDPFPASRFIDGYGDKLKAVAKGESDEWFHYRLVVTNGTARVYINGELWSCALADDYDGGYVALSLNAADTLIKNLSVTNYDAKEIVIASVQDTKTIGCDYIEIDKKKGDTLSLPQELEVTDVNGYTYKLQIDWVNDNYRSGKLGTYKFAGIPIMPSKMFKNPNNVATSSTVKVTKVDYNPSTTVKYYFDNANDLLDFTEYYSANTAESDLAVSNWKDHWTLNNGQLQRINDNFRDPSGDKFGAYRKMSRLVYNKELTGNYQIDVDYQQDTGTYMWAMICFATSDETQFVVDYNSKEEKFEPNIKGGTAVYLEKEGSVNFWGNMDNTNQEGTRLRLLDTIEKFEDYDNTEMHHMTVTVIDGVARVYIDDYETNVAVRIPDEALGGYVSLMSNSNAVTFDNFAITKLADDFEDGNVIKASDTTNIAFEHQNGEETGLLDSLLESSNILGVIIPALAIALACGTVAVLCMALRKKNEKEEV